MNNIITKDQKVTATRPFSFNRVHQTKIIHTSVKDVYKDSFTLRGYSNYLFSKEDMMDISVVPTIKVELLKEE